MKQKTDNKKLGIIITNKGFLYYMSFIRICSNATVAPLNKLMPAICLIHIIFYGETVRMNRIFLGVQEL